MRITTTAVALFVSWMASQALVAAPMKAVCWDGTFRYDTMTLIEVDDGYEFTLDGSTSGFNMIIKPDSFPANSKNRLGAETIFVKFPKAACQSSSPLAIECSQTQASQYPAPHLFVRTKVGDILVEDTSWPVRQVISPVALDYANYSLSVKQNADGLSFAYNRKNLAEETESHALSLSWTECHFAGTDHIALQPFPDALRAYIQSVKEAAH